MYFIFFPSLENILCRLTADIFMITVFKHPVEIYYYNIFACVLCIILFIYYYYYYHNRYENHRPFWHREIKWLCPAETKTAERACTRLMQ